MSGDPAPMVSENMLTKFLKAGGRSRNAVLGLMEAARDAGDYDVVVNNALPSPRWLTVPINGTKLLVLTMSMSFVIFFVTLLTEDGDKGGGGDLRQQQQKVQLMPCVI